MSLFIDYVSFISQTRPGKKLKEVVDQCEMHVNAEACNNQPGLKPNQARSHDPVTSALTSELF